MPSHYRYIDVQLTIRQDVGRSYVVEARNELLGSAKAKVPFTIFEESADAALQVLMLQAQDVRQRLLPEDEASARQLGQYLFEQVISGDVRDLYERCHTEAERVGSQVQLCLVLDPPEIAALPWELLYDARRGRGEFLCLSGASIVRSIEQIGRIRSLDITPPLRVLALAASPRDLPPLKVDLEQQVIEQAVAPLQSNGVLELEWLQGKTARDLQRALRRESWNVVHVVAHGGTNTEEGYLVLEDDDGQGLVLGATSLARLLASHNSLLLVILNTCDSSRPPTNDHLASIAATLVSRGIPAVVAMRQSISDSNARIFAQEFYESLIRGYSIETAVNEARKALSIQSPGKTVWGVPVIYLRASDGYLRLSGILTPHTDLSAALKSSQSSAIPLDLPDQIDRHPKSEFDSTVGDRLHPSVADVTTHHGTDPTRERRVITLSQDNDALSTYHWSEGKYEAPEWFGQSKTVFIADQPPPPITHFIGRDDILRNLSDTPNLPRVIVVLGIVGIGKTALLRQLATLFERSRTFWYEFRPGLSSLDELLSCLSHFTDNLLNAQGEVLQSLRRLPAGMRARHLIEALNSVSPVIFFDEAHHIDEDAAINSFLSELKDHLHHGTVFIASRSTPTFYRAFDPERQSVLVVPLEPLTDDEVQLFFAGRSSAMSSASKKAIARLGGLPLALELLDTLLQEDIQEDELVALADRVQKLTIDDLFNTVYRHLDPHIRAVLITASLFNLPFSRQRLLDAHQHLMETPDVRAHFTLLERRLLIHKQHDDIFIVHDAIRALVFTYVDNVNTLRSNLALWLVERPQREMIAHIEAILLYGKMGEFDEAAELAIPLIDECLIPRYLDTAILLLEMLDEERVSPEQRLWLVGCQGRVAAYREHFEEAEKLYRLMLDLAKVHGDLHAEAVAHLRIGVLYNDRDFVIAMHNYENCLKINQQINDQLAQAQVLNNIGGLHVHRHQFNEAEVAFRQGLALLDEIDAPDWRRLPIIGNLGYLYTELEQWDVAQSYDERALELAVSINSPHDQSLALYNRGVQESRQGHRDEAQSWYKQALAIAVEHSIPDVEELVQIAFGRQAQADQDYDMAIECFERVATIYEELGRRARLAVIRFDIGTFYWFNHDLTSSILQYEQGIALLTHLVSRVDKMTPLLQNVRNLAEESSEPRRLVDALITLKNEISHEYSSSTAALARVYGTIGHIFVDVLKRDRVGIACLQCEAKLLADRPAEQISAYTNLGVTYEQRGMYNKAFKNIAAALELLQKFPDPYLSGLNYYNRGNCFTKLGLWSEAKANYEQALEVAASTDRPDLLAAIQENMGELYRRQGRLDMAEELLEESLISARARADYEDITRGLNNLGLLYKRQGKDSEAIAQFEEAIELARMHGLVDAEANTLISLGNLFLEQDKPEDAKVYYERARLAARSVQNIDLEEGSVLSLGYAHHRLGTFDDIEEDFRVAAEQSSLAKRYDHLLQFLLLAAEINLEEGEIETASVQYEEAIVVALMVQIEREQQSGSGDSAREFTQTFRRLCESIEAAVKRGKAVYAEQLYATLTERIRDNADWGESSYTLLRSLRPIGIYLQRRSARPLWTIVTAEWRRARRRRHKPHVVCTTLLRRMILVKTAR
jgi:tetratricopeptide (TPR) repeat protein